MTELPVWLTTAEVAERWRVSAREVQRMASSGEISHMRAGRQIRISQDTVIAFERSHTTRARSRVPGR